jgi:hypothetical protein
MPPPSGAQPATTTGPRNIHRLGGYTVLYAPPVTTVGVPLVKDAKYPLYLLVEGRLFFDHADDVRNNYQFCGVRVRF